MTTKLKISSSLALPIDAATSTIVVYGGKGMGKTNLATVLVEEFAHAGIRFAVIDPMGVWWGVRHSADGKGGGLKVLILGGIHGDLPITPESGALVADLVVDEDVNVIIDISRRADGSMWAIAERVRFVTAYAKRIYQRQGEKRRPINQVIDEAARFAPQIVRQGDSDVAACMGAIAVLVEEGRNVGVGVVLVTQRSARLNKDVAELADCMIAFRIVGPNSMRAVLDWLGEHVDKSRLKEIGEKLRSLPRGSALVVSPGWLEFEGIVAMRKRETFDSSATPKAGSHVRAPRGGEKFDLTKYQTRLAELVEQQKTNDPKMLRTKIAELERQLAKKGAAVSNKIVEHVVEVPPINKAAIVVAERALRDAGKTIHKISSAHERGAAAVDAAVRAMMETGDKLTDLAAILGSELAALRRQIADVTIERSDAAKPTPPINGHRVPHKVPAAPRVDNGPGDASIGGGLRRMLVALAQCQRGLTNRQIGIRAGLSSKSGTFSTYLGRARSSGWVEDRGDVRMITDAGVKALGSYEPLPTGEGLFRHWMSELGNSGAGRILRVLYEAYPNRLGAAEVGERAEISPKSGTYSTYVGKLRGLELIEGGRDGLAASEELFA